MSFLKKPSGFTLIELMVAMVVGLIVAAIAMSMYVSLIRANATSIQVTRLTQSLQGALDVMERDIRRAGYFANAISTALDTSNVNPATFTISDLQRVSAAAPLYDCILIRYDSNGDGAVSGADEILGYKFDGTNQSIEFHSWDSVVTQKTDLCINSGWNSITNNGSTNVTNLSFTITPSSGENTMGQRRITISITGNSKQNQALEMTLQRDVRLRNDEY
jgi:prepilin-type N-terminal cleavage/methylation domain